MSRCVIIGILVTAILIFGIIEIFLDRYRLHVAAEWLVRLCLALLVLVAFYTATSSR